jgi:hypothetical protein
MSLWRGAPSDVYADMHLSFWHYEVWRLQYWVWCFFVGAVLWLLLHWSLQRWISEGATAFQYTLKIAILWATAVACIIGAEVATSILYWRQLPWSQPGYSGIPYSPIYPFSQEYVWEHLTSWAVVLALGLLGLFLWNRRRRLAKFLVLKLLF